MNLKTKLNNPKEVLLAKLIYAESQIPGALINLDKVSVDLIQTAIDSYSELSDLDAETVLVSLYSLYKDTAVTPEHIIKEAMLTFLVTQDALVNVQPEKIGISMDELKELTEYMNAISSIMSRIKNLEIYVPSNIKGLSTDIIKLIK